MSQVPKAENNMVNALANLDLSAPYPCHVELNVLEHSSTLENVVNMVKFGVTESWMTLIMSYLKGLMLSVDNK